MSCIADDVSEAGASSRGGAVDFGAVAGVVAELLHRDAGEGDIVCLGFDRVAANEAPEAVGTQVAFTAAPDRLRIGGDRDQLLDVAAPAAIVIGDEQQAHTPGAAVRVVEQRQAGKMNAAAAREVDVRLAAARGQAPAVDIVPNPVEGLAQLLLAARNDPGDDDEPVRGYGTSVLTYTVNWTIWIDITR